MIDSGVQPLLLDTDVLTFLTDPGSTRPEWADVAVGRTLVLTFVSVGEILHATYRAGWSEARVTAFQELLSTYHVIPGTISVARKYAELRRWFHQQVPDNDLWVAGCALSQPESLPLATGDAHFDRIAERFPLEIVRP